MTSGGNGCTWITHALCPLACTWPLHLLCIRGTSCPTFLVFYSMEPLKDLTEVHLAACVYTCLSAAAGIHLPDSGTYLSLVGMPLLACGSCFACCLCTCPRILNSTLELGHARVCTRIAPPHDVRSSLQYSTGGVPVAIIPRSCYIMAVTWSR